MNFKFVILFLLTPVLLFAQAEQAQVSLKVDRDTVIIGDMIHLQARVEYDRHLKITGPGLNGLPQNEYLEYQGRPNVTKESSEDGKKQILVEDMDAMVFLDSGWIDLPPVIYEAPMPDTTYVFSSNPVRVFVKPIVKVTDLPQGLRTIIKEPKKLSDYYAWIAGALAVLLGILLFLFLRNRKPKEMAPQKPKIPVKPPLQEAVESLEALQKQRLWESAPKETQVKLSQILRRYLERAHRIHALEESTQEIERDLKRISPSQKAQLIRLLNDSDLVKFAKMTMPNERQEQSILEAIQWVKRNVTE